MASDLVTQLSRKPLGTKLAILALAVAVVGFLYWQFFYSSERDALSSAETVNKRLIEDNKKLKGDKRKQEDLIKRIDKLNEEITRYELQLPASSELPSYFDRLQREAGSAGVKITTWKRLREEPAGNYVKVPVEIEVVGSFHRINQYFHLLYGTESSRVIVVEDLTMTEGKVSGDRVELSAKFIAATFRRKDVPPDTTLPAPPAAGDQRKSTVDKVKDARAQREHDVEARSGEPTPGTDQNEAPAASGDKSKPGVDRLKDPGAEVKP